MITLTPAYGRDYKSKKEVLKSLSEAKEDWIINDITNRWNGKPCMPKHDLLEGESFKVRYDKLRKVFITSIK